MLPTVLICLALLLIVVFSVRSYLKKLKTGCCGSGGDQVRVEGMHCQNCARRVENAFNAKEGFYAKVDLGKKTALVRSKREVPDEELKQVVRGLGYSPVAVEPA